MPSMLVAIGLVAYNNLLNLWPPFNGYLYVPLNLALTLGVSVLALGPLGTTRGDLGLEIDLADVALGAAIALAITVPLFVAARSTRGARWVADERVRGLSRGTLAYQVLVRIPIGTALLEEVAFRGVLFGTLRDSGPVGAALLSSAAFGLWHISPTLNLVRANRPGADRPTMMRAVAGAVAFTFVAGLVLVWLRVQTGGIAAPLALHACVNALATLAAVSAHRARRPAATPKP